MHIFSVMLLCIFHYEILVYLPMGYSTIVGLFIKDLPGFLLAMQIFLLLT